MRGRRANALLLLDSTAINPQIMLKTKEKRTKEEVLRLLNRAMEQEEGLLEKISILEAGLSQCRKKVKNPRCELDDMALPASKVSFQLDYYQTEEKASFKGIVEHLSSRESRTFEGNDAREIAGFVAQFVKATPEQNENSPMMQNSFA